MPWFGYNRKRPLHMRIFPYPIKKNPQIIVRMHDVHMKCGCTIVQCKVVCFGEILNVKAVVAAFNQEEALVLGIGNWAS